MRQLPSHTLLFYFMNLSLQQVLQPSFSSKKCYTNSMISGMLDPHKTNGFLKNHLKTMMVLAKVIHKS